MARLLGCDPKTIQQGRDDLNCPEDPVPDRVRKKRGGPKRLIETIPLLEQNLIEVLREHTAGDPMRVDVRWTNLSRQEMGRRSAEEATPAGKRVLRQLLKKLGFVKRKA